MKTTDNSPPKPGAIVDATFLLGTGQRTAPGRITKVHPNGTVDIEVARGEAKPVKLERVPRSTEKGRLDHLPFWSPSKAKQAAAPKPEPDDDDQDGDEDEGGEENDDPAKKPKATEQTKK